MSQSRLSISEQQQVGGAGRQPSFSGATGASPGPRLSISEQKPAVDLPQNIAKVFEGPKNFWRTRQSLDVVMLEYKDFDCIEINAWWETAPVDPDDVPKPEFQSIYVSATKAHAKVNQTDIEKRVAELEHDGKYGKVSHAQHAENLRKVLYDAVGIVLLGKIRMINVQIAPAAAPVASSETPHTSAGNSGSKVETTTATDDEAGNVDNTSNTSEDQDTVALPAAASDVPCRERFTLLTDEGSVSDVIIEKPQGLISIAETVRPNKKWGLSKRSTSFRAEFEATMTTFNAAVHDIDASTAKATRLQSIAHLTIDLMQTAIRKQEERKRMTKYRRLWKWAMHRVILTRSVVKVRERISQMTFPPSRRESVLAGNIPAASPGTHSASPTPPMMGSPKPTRQESKLVLPPIMESQGSEKGPKTAGRTPHDIVEAAKEARQVVSAASNMASTLLPAGAVGGAGKSVSKRGSTMALPAVGSPVATKEKKKSVSAARTPSVSAESAMTAPILQASASFTNEGGGGSKRGSKLITKTKSESVLKTSASAAVDSN